MSSCRPSTTSLARGRSTCACRGTRRLLTTALPRSACRRRACSRTSCTSASRSPPSIARKPPNRLVTLIRSIRPRLLKRSGRRIKRLQTRRTLLLCTHLQRRPSVPCRSLPCTFRSARANLPPRPASLWRLLRSQRQARRTACRLSRGRRGLHTPARP